MVALPVAEVGGGEGDAVIGVVGGGDVVDDDDVGDEVLTVV